MCAGDRQSSLSAVAGLRSNAMQQQGPTGNGLEMFVGLRQSYKQGPPVINECHHAGHHLAARQILSGKAAPSPLILQFVKVVLRVGAVTIQLRQRQYRVRC